jgi:hypothetical protein
MTQSTPKPPSLPPKSKEEEEAEAKFDAACVGTDEAAKKLDASATKTRRTISDSKMRAVRLPTPSQIEIDPAVKR